MSNIRHDNDASCAGFLTGYRPGIWDAYPVPITVTYAVIGLTNFGERGAPSARLAEVLGRPVMGPQECTSGVEEAARDGDIEDVDATVCAQMPLFASAEAAQGWLAVHPAGRVVPIREAWDLSPFRDWRDRMPALLNLGH